MRNVRGLLCLAVVSFLFAPAVAAESFPWQPTLESAKKVAAQTNRLVLIHFTAPWCEACRRMERDVFSNANVGNDLQANFVPVKINADHFPNTARRLGVTALPTTIIMTPSGQPLSTIRGRRDAAQYVSGLNQIAATSRQQIARNRPQPPADIPIPNVNVISPAPPAEQPPAAVSTEPVAGGRYADYFKRRPPVVAQTAPRYGDPRAVAAPVGQPVMGSGGAQLQALVQPPIQQHLAPPVVGMAGSPNMAQQPPGPPVAAEQGNNPPLCLEGFCAVSLFATMENPNAEKKGWVLGDRRWGAIHRGRTYLFAGPEQQKQFLGNPDRYAPVMSGNDVVMSVDQGQTVAGQRKFGAIFGNRIYLFASKDSLLKFEASPNRYANEMLQAMRAAGAQLR